MSEKTLIIGVGNLYRGDDAAGLMVSRSIQGKLDADIIEHDGEVTSLMDVMRGRKSVIIIDAVCSGANVGEILEYDLNKISLPDIFAKSSTHSFGISEAVELIKVIDVLPEKLIFYGVEGKYFDEGQGVCNEVNDSVTVLAEKIIKDLEKINA